MIEQRKITFLALSLLISFPVVNAVLFTPALPDIANFFAIPSKTTQHTMLYFLLGYALAQLIYAPLTDHFGEKIALYTGISLQITSCFICLLSGWTHIYNIFILGRFLLALGAGAGLKMTFTLANQYYSPCEIARKTSYLMIALAISPGISVFIGGILNYWFGWKACYYACALYGGILFYIVNKLQNIKKQKLTAGKPNNILKRYKEQFKKISLVAPAIAMGTSNAFVYIFATIGPFLAKWEFHMNSHHYGMAALTPPLCLVTGLIISAYCIKFFTTRALTLMGIAITGLGTTALTLATNIKSTSLSLFLPINIIYFGIAFILPNVSSIGMQQTNDKAYGSATLNFINIAIAAIMILFLEQYIASRSLLILFYSILFITLLLMFPLIPESLAHPQKELNDTPPQLSSQAQLQD